MDLMYCIEVLLLSLISAKFNQKCLSYPFSTNKNHVLVQS